MSDNIRTYPAGHQWRAAAEADSLAISSVCPMTLSECQVQIAWKQRQQSRVKHVDVCLVEDDSSIISTVRILLESASMDLLAVESYEGAILALRDTRPRLLLVDLGLPDRSGLEIARVVRGWYDYPHIPIVALTASAERAGAAWRAGFSGFIAKPFAAKTFQTMVKSWVSALTH